MTSAGSFVAYIHPAVNTLGFETATHAIELISNAPRYVAQRPALPTEKAAKTPRVAQPTRRTRQTTKEPEEHDPLLYTPCLAIDLNKPPKTSVGIVGGRNPDLDFCFDEVEGASWHHLSFTFNKDYYFIVRDLGSTGGTTVVYGTQSNGPRRDGEWIIGGHKFLKDKGPIIVKVIEYLQFRVVVPAYDPTCPIFRDRVDNFLRGSVGFDDLFLDLTLTMQGSETRLQTGAQTPSRSQAPLEWKLGEGTFGVVHYVCDCRTGREVARKIPKKGYNARRWKTEVLLMAQVSHPHIVAVLDYSIDESPFLDLEFIPGGSLDDHLKAEDYFSGIECVVVARQTTSAVEYLHGKKTTHRDISLKNIIVTYRTKNNLVAKSCNEVVLSVKIADFGLCKQGDNLKTWLGTPRYCAPEFYGMKTTDGEMVRQYTPAVDIWSLGVVLGELLCGLPKHKKQHDKHGLLWCQAIQDRVGNHPDEAQDDMTTFLLQNMLSVEPEGRSSAQECHQKALRLSKGTHDTWKSFQAVGSVEVTEDESDDESDELECEQETIRVKEHGSGTVRPSVQQRDHGIVGATEDPSVISSNEFLVQQLKAYLDQSDGPPPPDILPSSGRLDTQELLDRLQDPEDPLFHASQIGDDDHLSEMDNSTPSSQHDNGQCIDTSPPDPVETNREPSVTDSIPNSKRTRDWEAEAGRLLQTGLNAGLPGMDVNAEGHITKRVR